MDSPIKELFLDFMVMLYPKLLKILHLYVLEILEIVKFLANHYGIRVRFSIELFLVLWHKVVILQILMGQEGNQSTDINLMMKIFKFIILKGCFFHQQILDQTQMDPNFSLLSDRLPG
jgi:hypothetical protein